MQAFRLFLISIQALRPLCRLQPVTVASSACVGCVMPQGAVPEFKGPAWRREKGTAPSAES